MKAKSMSLLEEAMVKWPPSEISVKDTSKPWPSKKARAVRLELSISLL